MNQDEDSPWQYKPDGGDSHQPAPPDGDDPQPTKKTSAQSISWEAPEFIDHPHSFGWYSVLALCTAILAGLVFLIARDYVATGTIVIVGIIVGVFANQKPGIAKYEITDSGLSINGKLYRYGDYKSFAILQEGNLSSVNLFPLKRFMPPLSAYFDSKDEEKITNTLGDFLPFENRKLDAIDRLSRRLRL